MTQGSEGGPSGSGVDGSVGSVDSSGSSGSSGSEASSDTGTSSTSGDGTETTGTETTGTESTTTSAGLDNGEGCSSNEDCVNTCVDGLCADHSSLGFPCDLGDDDDCADALDCGTEPFGFFDETFEADSTRSSCVSDDDYVTVTLTMNAQEGWSGNGLEMWCFGDAADNAMPGVPKTGNRPFAGTAWAQADHGVGGSDTVTLTCPRGGYVWGSCQENENGDTPQQITLFNPSGFQFSGVDLEQTALAGNSVRVFHGILGSFSAAIVCELET